MSKSIKKVLYVSAAIVVLAGGLVGYKVATDSCCSPSCSCPGGCPEGYHCEQPCMICWTFGSCSCQPD